MKINEIKKDLFQIDNAALVHCISSDFAMGKGIAVRFRNMGVKTALHNQYDANTWTGHGYCLPVYFNGLTVYNMVTKAKYFEKPTYTTFKEALTELKDKAVKDNCKNLAMPKIGCGLDRLDWTRVRKIIEEVFADCDINITVCYI